MNFQFPERNQNFWQLTCIQSASQSISAMLIGGALSRQYGPKMAILSICVGNLILWIIGLGVISMAAKERKNAIENVKGFLGKGSSIAMAIILIVAFLSWYMLEIQSSMATLAPLFPSGSNFILPLLGGAFGILIAILSMGGIRIIRKVCVMAFPFLLGFVLYEIFTSDLSIIESGSWGLSFSGIVTVVAITLAGTVNLPTFFRHSHSRADSFLALTLMTFFFILFQVSSIFTTMINPADVLASNSSPIYHIAVFIFVALALIALNLINIYFAAAGFELLFPRLGAGKGNLIVGLIGTVIYVVLQNPEKMVFLEEIGDNFLANLGVVLLISYLIKAAIKHRTITSELIVNSFCWGVGCVVALIVQINYPEDPNRALIIGLCGSIISFFCIIFVEETIWAMKRLLPQR